MTISLTFYRILTPSHNILDVHINEYDKCILSNGTRIVNSNAVNTTYIQFIKKNSPHYEIYCKYYNVMYNVKM